MPQSPDLPHTPDVPEAPGLDVPDSAPAEVIAAVREGTPRAPVTDPTLGTSVRVPGGPEPKHRLVVIGDSLSHGFQSGAVYNTDLSWPAIVAHELGWDGYHHPRYSGFGGIGLNIEYLLRDLESRFGTAVSVWETPFALFRARQLLDEIEDYWERGGGNATPVVSSYVHDLAVYGWDLRDALERTAATCEAAIGRPRDNLLKQIIENNAERAARQVYPQWAEARGQTLFDAARAMGADHGADQDSGIETLVVFLGANNALQTVTKLKVAWTGPDCTSLAAKAGYTAWAPSHFRSELEAVVEQVRTIEARHVIFCTVPHVTIPPIARGVGGKLRPGSRYFPYYTRPWISDDTFDPEVDPHITAAEARAVDAAIDLYNAAIEQAVAQARDEGRDWLLLDTCGVLDRLATRRYTEDPSARPDWWTPYELPPALQDLTPEFSSRFLTSDGNGGRATGGLFSLDGVHPTTVGYGLVAQEVIDVMSGAGVEFRRRNGGVRNRPRGGLRPADRPRHLADPPTAERVSHPGRDRLGRRDPRPGQADRPVRRLSRGPGPAPVRPRRQSRSRASHRGR